MNKNINLSEKSTLINNQITLVIEDIANTLLIFKVLGNSINIKNKVRKITTNIK